MLIFFCFLGLHRCILCGRIAQLSIEILDADDEINDTEVLRVLSGSHVETETPCRPGKYRSTGIKISSPMVFFRSGMPYTKGHEFFRMTVGGNYLLPFEYPELLMPT